MRSRTTRTRAMAGPAGLPGRPAGPDLLAELAAHLLGCPSWRITLAPVTLEAPLAVAEGHPAGFEGRPVGYLAVPLTTPDGRPLGALWVFADGPRDWTPDDVAVLVRLAAAVVVQLEPAGAVSPAPAGPVARETAFDAAEVGTFDWDLVTGRLVWDDRLIEMFGYDRTTFTETIEDFSARVHPDDRDRVDAAVSAAVVSCGRYAADYRVVPEPDVVRWVGARGRAIAGPDGTAVRLVGAAFDLTDWRDGESRVARVLESMPAAFFSLDDAWRFTYVNAEAERLLGLDRERLRHDGTVWELLPHAADGAFAQHAHTALRTGRVATFEEYFPEPLRSWFEVRIWPTEDGLSVYVLDAGARRAERDRAEREATRAALLADVTSRLVGTLDPEEGVARLAQLICPTLAEWCVITLVGDDHASLRGLRDLGWWHADPALMPLVESYATTRLDALGPDSHLARVLRTGEPVVMTSGAMDTISALLRPGTARDVLGVLAPGSGAVLPLRGRGGIVGLLSVFNGPDRPLTADVLATLHEIADRAGLAVDNARLYAHQRDLAQSLQRSLLTDPPPRDGLEIAVRYVPAAAAAQVGGDWYDVLVQPEGSTTFVIGDVVGHDTAAVATMGQLRGMLRGIALSGRDGPLGVLTKLDEVIVALDVDVTASAVVARLDGERLRWANAGHPPPMLLPADGAEIVALGRTAPDLLLGIDPATDRHEQEITPAPGDVLLFYTDGLVERREQSLDEGSALLRRTLATLRGTPLDALCDQLLSRMLPAQPEDDVAVLAVKFVPAGVPPTP